MREFRRSLHCMLVQAILNISSHDLFQNRSALGLSSTTRRRRHFSCFSIPNYGLRALILTDLSLPEISVLKLSRSDNDDLNLS